MRLSAGPERHAFTAGLVLLVTSSLACQGEPARRASEPIARTPQGDPIARDRAAAPPSPLPPSPTAAAPAATSPSAAASELELAYFRVQGVAAADVLNIRGGPDSSSRVLGTLAPSATGVEGIGTPIDVGATRWRRVRHGGIMGWANERFLVREDGAVREGPPELASPEQSAVLTPLICFGTEPFWSIRFGSDGSATCGAMCEGPPGLRLANLRITPSGDPESFDLLGAGRAMYLRAAMRKTGQCSDGMSDFSYPYQFEGVGSAGALSGCCRNEKDAPGGLRP